MYSHCVQGDDGHPAKLGLQMPLYAATLQHMPKPLPFTDALIIGEEVLEGLLHMHSCGWGHCDVKSPNIFLTHEGHALLGDYGAARELGSDADEKTLSHIAEDLPFNADEASVHLDKYLLAVTLLDKLGMLQLGATTLLWANVQQAVQGLISRVAGDAAQRGGFEKLHAFITSLLPDDLFGIGGVAT